MRLMLMLALLMGLGGSAAAQTVLYEGPEGMAASEETRVFVDGAPLFVYETAVNHNRAYEEYPTLASAAVAYFDFSGSVTIEIEAADMQSLTLRPLSLGLEAEVEDGRARFTLENPAHITAEINGDPTRAAHIFASPLERDAPAPDDENVLYYGPGIHEVPIVRLRDGQTLYLAGGAVLRGSVTADKAANITVRGRGIIDGSVFDRWTQQVVPIDFNLCENVRIEGITILDPAAWTVNTFACKGVYIGNVKIISARPNGDGFTAQSCSDYLAENCFVRSWDDSLVVKNYGNGISHDIVFRDIVLWTDLAQSCEIGYETRGPEIYNVTFENITVLHNFHKPVLSVHNSDYAHVRDILFKNIVVEDARMGGGDGDNYLIELTIAESVFSQSDTRGKTSNIRFENIEVLDGVFPSSRIEGFDEEHAVEGVSIQNLVILGEKILDAQGGRFLIGPHASGVTFAE